MSRKENFNARDLGKFHQKTRLETVVRDCWNCRKPTVYFYLGDYGLKEKPAHTYQCTECKVHYTSAKKLKGEK